ncbi:hypothetical protein QUA54_06800 [Microcoleus sp. MOSTC5]|uniref:hypothetical protein n=1 Tax=Microcoleus sp. MOSTC5 TaxID=3055378 RepID=UPI002FD4FE78
MNCSNISQNYDRHSVLVNEFLLLPPSIDGGNTCASPDYSPLWTLAINSGDRLRGLRQRP